MARRWVNLVGVTPLLLGMMVGVPQMVMATVVLAQNSQVAQSQKQFAEVKIDGLETYRHPSGLFSLDVPVGWTIKDTSKPDEIIISWTDPNTNSLVIMNVFEITSDPSTQELQSKLQDFIRDLFGSQPQFQLVDLPPQGDGSRGVSWAYQVTTQVGNDTLKGRSLIVQSDNKVVILSVAYPQTQEAQLQENFNQIISSARIDAAINLSTATQGNQNSQQREAQQLYNEGERLRRQGTSESLQQALAKFQEALLLFRANSDRNGEAENLESIGNVYLGLRQGEQAFDYYQQALQIYRQRGDSTEERLRRRYGEARTLTNIGTVYRTFFRFSTPRFGGATTIKDIGELSGSRLLSQLALNSYQQALLIYRELGDRRGEANTLNQTADVYQYMRQYQQALSFYQQAIQIYQEVGDRNGEAATLNDIAFVYQVTRQRLQALSFYQQALKIYRELGDRSGETRILNNIADMSIGGFGFSPSFTPRGRFARFGEATSVEDTVKNIGELSGDRLESQLDINFYQQVLLIWRELGDRKREATTLNNIGGRTQLPQALSFYQQVIQIYRELGERSGEARTLISIANRYKFAGQPQQALSYYQQAIQIYQELGDRREEAETLKNIGGIMQPQQALNYYQQAIQIYRELGDRPELARTLNDIGSRYRYPEAEIPQAINFYQQAIQIYRELGDRKGEAATLNEIAITYQLYSSQAQLALNSFQQVLPIYRELGDRKGEAETLRSIGLIYLIRMDQPQQALNYLQQALPILRELGNSTQERLDRLFNEARTLNDIGDVYLRMGQPEQALNFHQQALPIWREQGSRAGEADTLNDIGDAYLRMGQPEQALNFYQQALPIWREQGSRAGEANTLNNIARTYRDMGQPERALNYAQQASAISGILNREANILNTAANIYRQNIRQYQQTLSFYQQALPIYQAVNSPVFRVGNSPEERLSQRTGEADGGVYRSIVQPTEKVFTLNSIGRVYYSIGQQSIFIQREENGGNSQQTVGRCRNSSVGNVGSNSIAGGSVFTPLCSSPPPNSSAGDVR